MATRRRNLLNLAVVVVLVKCFIHCLSSSVIDKARLYGYSYRNISVSGIQLCAKECLTESWCKSFNFHRNYLSCELNYESSELEYIAFHEDYVYSNASFWAPIIVDACSDHSCGVNEKCIVLKRNRYICLQIAFCMDPSYTLDKRSNICYKVIDLPRLNWYAADGYCHSDNGRLISLDTREKGQAIGDHIFDQYNSTGFNGWIGLTDVEEEGSFVWVNGNNLIHDRFWVKGQPNDYYIGCPNFTMEEEGDFGVMNKYGLWHDACWLKELKFICETKVNYIIN